MRERSIVHTLSKNNLMDYWTAYYDRYMFLSKLTDFKEDRKILDYLEKQVASTTIRTWIETYRIPKKQRDYDSLHKISDFVQTHFSTVEKRNWGRYLQICLFFIRYANRASFAIVYMLYCIYQSIINPFSPNRRDRRQKLFPSA